MSTDSKACLALMPDLVKQKIISKLDFKSRCQLSRVSKTFTHQVEIAPFHFDRVSLNLEEHELVLELRIKFKNYCKFYEYEEHAKAVSDCFRILRNCRETIGAVEFGWDDLCHANRDLARAHCPAEKAALLASIQQHIREFRPKMQIKNLYLEMNLTVTEIVEFISFTKTASLNELTLRFKEQINNSELLTMKPFWQQLTTLEMTYADDIPISSYHHVNKGFVLGARATLDELKALTQAFLHRPDEFKEFYFTHMTYDCEEFKKYILPLCSRREGHFIQMHKSEAYLSVHIDSRGIYFKKHWTLHSGDISELFRKVPRTSRRNRTPFI